MEHFNIQVESWRGHFGVWSAPSWVFGNPIGCSGGPRASKKESEGARVSPGAREPMLVPTWVQHGPNLDPKWIQKQKEDDSKLDQN